MMRHVCGVAVVGPWCEKYLVLGLEQGLLMVFRKDHRPEGFGSDHREGEDKGYRDVGGSPRGILDLMRGRGRGRLGVVDGTS